MEVRNYKHLSESERYMTMTGLKAGHSLREIGRSIGRAASTISREIKRNKLSEVYEPVRADKRARTRRKQPRKGKKLDANRHLKMYVVDKLERSWSPEQIIGRLLVDFPNRKDMRISHETIYAYIYAMPKSELRKELIAKLRRKHPKRLKQGRGSNAKKARIADMVSIHERPHEIEGRQIMGNWEGDLIIGKNHGSAVGTLVERKSRYVYLTQLNNQTATETRLSFTRKLEQVPPEMRLSLTYDQGTEMSQHKKLTSELDMAVYFCDPHAPWQKGTVENTNGLVREFLPKGTDLSDLTQDELDAISYALNTRPRKALGFLTPQEVYMQEFRKYKPLY